MKNTTKSKLKGIDIVTHINKTIEEYGPIKSVLVTTGTIGIAGCGYVQYQIENIISENELDIDIIELYVHGSRINGNPHKDSDLDVVLYYKGNMKEDSLFNILHDDEYKDELTYNKVYIDINPIRDEETGSLASYIQKDKII